MCDIEIYFLYVLYECFYMFAMVSHKTDFDTLFFLERENVCFLIHDKLQHAMSH